MGRDLFVFAWFVRSAEVRSGFKSRGLKILFSYVGCCVYPGVLSYWPEVQSCCSEVSNLFFYVLCVFQL